MVSITMGGQQQRNPLGLSQDKLKMPGPADYEGKTSIYDRIRKKNNTDMLVSPRSLRNSHHSFTSLRDREKLSPTRSDRSS